MCIAGFILNLLFELVGHNNYVNSLVLWAVSLNFCLNMLYFLYFPLLFVLSTAVFISMHIVYKSMIMS